MLLLPVLLPPVLLPVLLLPVLLPVLLQSILLPVLLLPVQKLEVQAQVLAQGKQFTIHHINYTWNNKSRLIWISWNAFTGRRPVLEKEPAYPWLKQAMELQLVVVLQVWATRVSLRRWRAELLAAGKHPKKKRLKGWGELEWKRNGEVKPVQHIYMYIVKKQAVWQIWDGIWKNKEWALQVTSVPYVGRLYVVVLLTLYKSGTAHLYISVPVLKSLPQKYPATDRKDVTKTFGR